MLKIAQISDTHVSDQWAFKREIFDIILSKIDKSDCDLVVHTGDITNSGFRNEYELASSYLDSINKPLITIPGNHDSRNVGYELYEDYIGPRNGFYEGENFAVVYIDSTAPDQNEGRVESHRFKMLRKNLERNKDKEHLIVLVHHHLLPVPKAGRERNVLHNAGDLLNLLQRYEVDLVLTGHKHVPNVYKYEDMVIINAGCASCTKTRFGDFNSMNWIKLDKKKIELTTERLDGELTSKKFSRAKKHLFQPETNKLLRIAQISDTYITQFNNFEDKKFTNAVNSINNLDPDLVVHCGDIVNRGTTKNYRIAKKLLEKIEPPLIIIPGPKDINYLGYDLFPKVLGSYNTEYENDYLKILGVPTAKYDTSIGRVGELAINEIKKSFKSYEGIKAVFLHHNVIPLPHVRERGLLEDAGDLLDSLSSIGVDLILTGSSTYPHVKKLDGMLVTNAGSLSSRLIRNPTGNSFNLIDIYPDIYFVSEIHSLWGSKRVIGLWQRDGDSSEKEKK